MRKITIRKPFKRNRSGNWYIEVNRKRISLGTADYSEAMRIYNDVRKEYEKGTHTQYLAEACTINDFANRYLAWAVHVKPQATYNNIRYALTKLQNVAGGMLLANVTLEHADAVIADCKRHKLRNNSINTFVRYIKSVFNKAVDWGLLSKNPFKALKQLPRENDVVPRYASQKRIEIFLAGIADQDVKDLITVYFYTGRRRKEILGLSWADVDLKKKSYRIIKSKANMIYEYPMHGIVYENIKRRQQTKGRVFARWQHESTITHQVKKELRKAGLGHLHLHSLRHSFAMAYLEKGGDIKSLKDLMGHEQLSTTEIYTRALSMQRLKNEIRRL